MAYIGAEPVPGQNREVDDISSGFNGNATAFTLQVSSVNVSPESANNILINLGGVLQNPGTDYTVNASTLTFTTAPASGLSFFGLILGAGINTATVADGTISTAKIVDQAVDLTKLPHGTGSNDGKFLRANNGADPSFETVGGNFGSQAISTTGGLSIDGATVFNEAGANVDFRIEGDNNANLFFVDADVDKIGLGTNNPSNFLHCVTSDTTVARFASTASGGTGAELILNHNSSSPADNDNIGAIYFQANHDGGAIHTYSYILSQATDVSDTTEDSNLIFATSVAGTAATRMSIDSSGNVNIADGNLVIGTAGHGIDFSASADGSGSVDSGGEVLDDYEEGTFNVNYKTGAAGSNTLSAAQYTSTGGVYTKIGNMVHFAIRIKTSSHTAVGGQIVIEGLPFTQANGTIVSGAYTVLGAMLGSSPAYLHIDGTEIRFQTQANANFGSTAGGVNFNEQFHCAGTYTAA